MLESAVWQFRPEAPVWARTSISRWMEGTTWTEGVSDSRRELAGPLLSSLGERECVYLHHHLVSSDRSSTAVTGSVSLPTTSYILVAPCVKTFNYP